MPLCTSRWENSSRLPWCAAFGFAELCAGVTAGALGTGNLWGTEGTGVTVGLGLLELYQLLSLVIANFAISGI